MAESPPTPRQTLALLLGASEYPQCRRPCSRTIVLQFSKGLSRVFDAGREPSSQEHRLGFSTITARPSDRFLEVGAFLNARPRIS